MWNVTLGQAGGGGGGLGGFDPADPAPLVGGRGSVVDQWVLESPLVLALGLVLVGIVVGLVLRGRTDGGGRLKVAPAVLVLLGVGVYGLGQFVRTPRERAVWVVRDLVAAVARGDAADAGGRPGLEALLGPKVQIVSGVNVGGFAPIDGMDRGAILERVRRDFAKGGLMEVKETGWLKDDAIVDGTRAVVQAKVRVTSAQMGYPLLSWWRVELERDGDGWRAVGIMPLAIGGRQ